MRRLDEWSLKQAMKDIVLLPPPFVQLLAEIEAVQNPKICNTCNTHLESGDILPDTSCIFCGTFFIK